ncbi:DEK C terminal domain [Seminavis robusta]|uniref:Crossover junction endonuclease MUS81 n=1 Tax=Seminavis robusta TaxID=568900 RepID=A0A9N8HSC8_9STRA|nr:DEK C terminal domain [Seminavis robusta]|eukprot:Sro1702_g292260.1 DEK C terminal domain (1091) ;mRNA; f:18189-21461
MADEIVCLSSDDDEVKVAAPAPPSRRRRKSNVARGKGDGSSVAPASRRKNDIVEILSDSDEEEGQVCSRQNGSSNSGGKALFLDQMERAKAESLKVINTTTTKKRTVNRVSLGQSLPANDDSDSDDSIDALLVDIPGISKKKAPAASKASPLVSLGSMQPATANLSQSSVDSSASARKSTPVVNPYAKKNPVTPRNNLSRPSPTPIVNPYTKKTTNSNLLGAIDTNTTGFNPSIFPIDNYPYPRLLPRSKQYPDLRASFLLAFWSRARSYTTQSHTGPNLHGTVTKVVSLALWPYPLRSLEEFCQRKTSNSSKQQDSTQYNSLQQELDAGKVHRIQLQVGASGTGGRFCSIVEACLASLYVEVEKRRRQKRLDGNSTEDSLQKQLASKDMWVSLADLIPAIQQRLLPCCPGRLLRKKDGDGGVAYYTDQSTKSAEYMQIEKLKIACTTHTSEVIPEHNNGSYGYIREHKLKKQVVFELTPLGWNTAQWILNRHFPSGPGHYRTSNIHSLDLVERGYKDICVGVDRREGGCGRNGLQSMLNHFDIIKMPYFVDTLMIGDYIFVWTGSGPDYGKLCPILVERKSIEDVALSMADGRWQSQKQRMYHGQFVFGYHNCRIAYVIEGKEEKQQVSGGYIAHRKLGITRENLDDAIRLLRQEGFDVLRTSSAKHTFFELSKWAKKVGQDVREGKLTLEFGYETFKAEVKKIPPGTDFSRLAKYHMQQRVEGEEKAKAASSKGKQSESIDDNNAASIAKQPSSSKPDSAGAIDLCSDDSDQEDVRESITVKKSPCQAVAAGKREEKKSKHSSNRKQTGRTTLKDVTKSHSQQSNMFKPSQELLSYFEDDAGSSSDDEDEDLARALATLKRAKKGEAKHRKRKLAAAEAEKSKKPKKAVRRTKSATTSKPSDDAKVDAQEETSKENRASPKDELTVAQLQQKCAEFGLPKTGTKADLLERLKGPKPPAVWLQRKKDGEYVPARHNTGACALLVALFLHEREVGEDAPGLSKDELYAKAEALEISKNSFSGGTTQTGPYHYDGWSSMSSLLQGDPALVKQKRQRYKLTRSSALAGWAFAKAMHKWCHEHGVCNNCGQDI